jgi:hypothetical protein
MRLLTFPSRHIDIRLLPSLVPNSAKNETAHVIQPELIMRINKLKKLIDAGVIDQDPNGKYFRRLIGNL